MLALHKTWIFFSGGDKAKVIIKCIITILALFFLYLISNSLAKEELNTVASLVFATLIIVCFVFIFNFITSSYTLHRETSEKLKKAQKQINKIKNQDDIIGRLSDLYNKGYNLYITGFKNEESKITWLKHLEIWSNECVEYLNKHGNKTKVHMFNNQNVPCEYITHDNFGEVYGKQPELYFYTNKLKVIEAMIISCDNQWRNDVKYEDNT